MGTPIGKGFQSVNVRASPDARPLREPAAGPRTSPAIQSRFEDVDLVIVRENTEDLYAGLEHMVVPGVVESLKIITEAASTRIAQFAFDYARANGRKRVTAVHKANIMKLSDGLFLDCFRRVAEEYPDIESDELIVDAALHAARHATPRASTSSCSRTSTATSSPISARASSAASASCRAPTSAPTPRSSRRCTARRPTSPDRTRPTRPRF